MSDYAISWNFFGGCRILPTATDLFFHLPFSIGTLTSAVVVHRRLDNLGKGKEENKRCFGHFTNETKTNKKAKERNRPGKQLVYAKAGIHSEILSVSGTFAFFKCFSAVNILFIVLHVTDPTGPYREETRLLLAPSLYQEFI